MAGSSTQAVPPEQVFCEVCLKPVPKATAMIAETRDYVAYFCGLRCYEKWQAPVPKEPSPEPEVQLGHGRSRSKDDRMKRSLHKTPKRDEPRIDSVEPEDQK
jgi:hypothetical protein